MLSSKEKGKRMINKWELLNIVSLVAGMFFIIGLVVGHAIGK